MANTIVHHSSWAVSANGQKISLFTNLLTLQHSLNTTTRVANTTGVHPQKPLLFIGGVHGDEPEGVRLAEDFLNWIQKNSNTPMRPWILIPCLNPDGYFRKERTNGNHVDLNRNFPCKDWSSEHKQPRYFPGTGPNSEPETQALVQLIEQTKPELIIHFHSWKPCVVYTGSVAKPIADWLAKDTNYLSKEDIGYPTPGSLGQYGWIEKQIPVICIEEQEGAPLETVWENFGKALIDLITSNQIKYIFFDLDDTLLDTSHLLIPIAGTEKYYEQIKQSLPLMANSELTLNYLKNNHELFLITQGDPEIQQQKIKSLEIAKFFKEIVIVNPKLNETKLMAFSRLREKYQMKPFEFLSIGNRKSTDLRFAKMLGGYTCLFHHGEHMNEEIIIPEDQPDFIVNNHQELLNLCQQK